MSIPRRVTCSFLPIALLAVALAAACAPAADQAPPAAEAPAPPAEPAPTETPAPSETPDPTATTAQHGPAFAPVAGQSLMVARDGRFVRLEVIGPASDGGWILHPPGAPAGDTVTVTVDQISGRPGSPDPLGLAAFYLDAIERCNTWSHEVGNGGLDMSSDGPTASIEIIGPAGGEERWIVADAAGSRLLLDLAQGVVEGADGELPILYTFCPEDLFLGYADA
jgi:hypothetical protein